MQSKTRWCARWGVAAFALAACGDNGSGDDDAVADGAPGEVSFSTDIQPVFDQLCVDCHWDGSPIAVSLESPFDPDEGIIDRENSWVRQGSEEEYVVDPGNVDNSFLVTKVVEPELDSSVDGGPMPLHVAELTAEELDAVEEWIADGANDDAFFQNEVAPIFGTELTLGGASGKCTFCHYPGAPNGLSVLDVFDPDEGMVDVESVFGGNIVEPGDPDESVLMGKLRGDGPGQAMPLHHRRLTDDEIQAIIDWVAQGAPEN